MDEKRANTFLQTYGAYSATVGGDACSTGDSVTQNGEKSNTDISEERQGGALNLKKLGLGAIEADIYYGRRYH